MDDEPENKPETRLQDVHSRALRRFDDCAVPQLEVRALALLARRFVSIPGAQWDGEWGEQFDKSIKVEVNKTGRGLQKIENDYRQNRIVPDFRPDGASSDQGTADMLDGLHRADSYTFKSQQARDNAFSEAAAGGFGAYRLCNEWEDEYDKANDFQRINPAMIITDADQSVFFDGNSKLYDKSDARFAYVVTAMTRDAFNEEYGDDAESSWPENRINVQYDWYMPDVVKVAEYYEKEDVKSVIVILTHPISQTEDRRWEDEFSDGELDDLKVKGWQEVHQKRKRCRIHKYILSGAEILADKGFIAGDCIPIVPVYGQRFYVDGIERFKGYVQDKMDPQRLYNSNVSKLAETNALAPREVPIFAAEQMPPHLAQNWANMNIERHPYALVEPLRDEAGNIVSAGPIGKVEPPQIAPVQAALLQISNQDLLEDMADGADTVKANTSADAMDIAAARVDAKSGIYLDNMRQSVQREGEIYLSMAKTIYADEGRKVDTMSEDGDDGSVTLMEPYTDDKGHHKTRHDLARGKYKVIASVTEATTTRRDKSVRSSINLAEIAATAGDNDLAQISLLTAVMNQDGEGTADLQKYARKRLVGMGVIQPNEEEKAEMEAASQQEQAPDPTAEALMAQAEDFKASAAKKVAEIKETEANTNLKEAQTIKTLGEAANNNVPRIQMGRDIREAP